jgi:hypothetical protein
LPFNAARPVDAGLEVAEPVVWVEPVDTGLEVAEPVVWVEPVDAGLEEEGDELQAASASASASEANTSRVLLNICASHTFHGGAGRLFVALSPAA